MRSIYLDHAASCPCDLEVLEAMRPFFFEQGANASSPHQGGRRVRKAIEDARQILADFLGADPAEIIFTSGATESNNHAIFSIARALKTRGSHIVASAIEHHSVLEPLRVLSQEGFKVSLVKPQSDGVMSIDDIKAAIASDTTLVCILHANNEIGTIQPVEELGCLCQERQICLLVDATQTVGHIPVNVKNMHCDFLSLSAHKFYGPKGVGALYWRRGLQGPSFIFGGDQEKARRAGTSNTPGIVGLGEAIKICQERLEQDSLRETGLRDKIIDFVLKEIPGSRLNGHRQKRLPNNAHFSFENIKSEELISALDLAGVAVSMGSACTWGRMSPSHTLKAIGLSDDLCFGSLRVTIGRWTSEEDINYFLEQLKMKLDKLRNAKTLDSEHPRVSGMRTRFRGNDTAH